MAGGGGGVSLLNRGPVRGCPGERPAFSCCAPSSCPPQRRRRLRQGDAAGEPPWRRRRRRRPLRRCECGEVVGIPPPPATSLVDHIPPRWRSCPAHVPEVLVATLDHTRCGGGEEVKVEVVVEVVVVVAEQWRGAHRSRRRRSTRCRAASSARLSTSWRLGSARRPRRCGRRRRRRDRRRRRRGRRRPPAGWFRYGATARTRLVQCTRTPPRARRRSTGRSAARGVAGAHEPERGREGAADADEGRRRRR